MNIIYLILYAIVLLIGVGVIGFALLSPANQPFGMIVGTMIAFMIFNSKYN
jgi:membrane-bound ClpP family serine protease